MFIVISAAPSAAFAAPADAVADLRMNEDIFRAKDGSYARKNYSWSGWGPGNLIESRDARGRKRFTARIERLVTTCDEVSDIYQKSKGTGAEFPLK
jgi:hypothetical protein